MDGVQVMGFQKEYPSVNLKMQKETPKFYDYAILNLHAFETEHGFKVKKIGKTTRKGTKVTYEAFKSQEDSEEYRKFLINKVKEFNEKWRSDVKVE
ncbi:hypothetical protein ACQPUL_01025 [Clostridium butyricum]|uniref:hypothetical protein n=1 Tax=Clostridium butyricum TaxID=1492 RepID=UPI00071E9DC7|nr:hypothetical protein [Clostridium butyricum]ALS16904.1 hypothetical protein ATD26_08500 [Clostridium butyricum]MBS5982318.1 hypothetical protein [Clostridium butyricum]MDU6037802.1 hypothetical protein [Clostridium butyricum]